MATPKDKSQTHAIKDFLINTVLTSDHTITTAELKVLRAQIRCKLADLAAQAHKLVPGNDAETYNSILLTALTLKCVLSLSNKIEKENEELTKK